MKMRSNMKKWIASAGIFAAISMGLIACGDNSSSAESSSRPGSNDYCKVVSTDPFLIESVENGYFSQTTVKYEDEKLVEKVVFDDAIAAQMACDSYKKDVSYGKVVCKDNTIAAIGRDIMTASEYRDVLTLFSTMCEGDAHREDISSSSAERLSSSSERKSSSSRNVNSSSSSKTVSSSSERVESSSSSETSSDEDENWCCSIIKNNMRVKKSIQSTFKNSTIYTSLYSTLNITEKDNISPNTYFYLISKELWNYLV